MTRSVEIPEAAVEVMAETLARTASGRLWDQYTPATRRLLIDNAEPTARDALAAALPYLAPAERPVIDRAAARRAIYTALFGSPEGTYDNVEVALDAVMALTRSGAEVKAEALREAGDWLCDLVPDDRDANHSMGGVAARLSERADELEGKR